MDDTISRQATIDAIEQHKTAVLEGLEVNEGIAYGYAAAHIHLVEIVRKLPSTERWGRWISQEYMSEIDSFIYTEYKCSNCGEISKKKSNYCPNCGAKIDEVSE